MYYTRTITAIVLSFVLSNSILGIEVSTMPDENNTIGENSSAQPKKQKTLQESRNAVLSKLKPTPGSHFDENYHIVIDDPEVYKKALEKEKAKRKPLYPESSPQQKERGPLEIFYRVYKRNPVLGVLFFIAVAIVAIILLNIRDTLKKSKK